MSSLSASAWVRSTARGVFSSWAAARVKARSRLSCSSSRPRPALTAVASVFSSRIGPSSGHGSPAFARAESSSTGSVTRRDKYRVSPSSTSTIRNRVLA
ncbi:Uncharacterised protein [Flavonifractor plautii]|uniref:Uncharacterized protein n=1 Tax=Flavonifractor plautii TaxID=292800 RepID=A0A174JHS8_FLAPL|nr:Uncharacterised protein [Flavonifractor plautii]